MFILSILYKQSKNITGVETVLRGLRVVIVVIAVIAAAMFLTKLHPALVLLIAAMLGLLLTKKEATPAGKLAKIKTFRFFLIMLLIVAICSAILFFVDKQYFILATIMLRIDLFSFGGGLAAMPIMYHELVDLFGWFDKQTNAERF